MKKIIGGKFEIKTTKTDAINKFIQMQGICREKISGENIIEFYCSKKGDISITNPPKRHIENESSTKLLAEIIEQDGKIYVTYYTSFSKSSNILKRNFIVIDILMAISAIALAIINVDNTVFLLILFFALIFSLFNFLIAQKKKKILQMILKY